MVVKDYLFIENFETFARVGVTVEERARAQKIYLSLKIFLDLKTAGRSDDLKATIDYSVVTKTIKKILEQNEFLLVEKVAETIATKILKEKLVGGVEIKIGKKAFEDIGLIGAHITRMK